MNEYLLFFVSVLLISLVAFVSRPNPSKVLGVYSQPGKWYSLKCLIFGALLRLRKRRNERRKVVTQDQNAGYGMRSRSTPEDMDKVQTLPSEEPMAVDAVYFNGGSQNGTFFVSATARRQNNRVQTLLYLRIPDLGLLELTSLPDTDLQATEADQYAAGGLKMQVVEPMKKWKIMFNGKMRLVEKQEELNVKFSFDWVAYTSYFDFDVDLNPQAITESICRETWSRQYFDTLKKAHQTHYEQFGEITGTVHIEKYGEREILVQGVRDHSYGNVRRWKDLHRYGMQYFHCENGMAGLFGMICMPISMTRLLVGYIFHPDGKMDTVSSSDFEFYRFGENGHPPKHLECNFVAGGKDYALRCDVVQDPIFFIGEKNSNRIHERFCKYTVNGVQGWGISEWNYRHNAFHPEDFEGLAKT